MKALVLGLMVVAAQSAGPRTQTFTGIIADDLCAEVGHGQMRMGPTDAECATACVIGHGAKYVVYDGKEAYVLSDQKTPEKFAAQKVTVVGTLDAKTKTIQVKSITAAK